MRALVALALLLPFVLSARVFNDPYHLRSLARQAVENGVPRVPPEFNINAGGPAVGRFVADAPEWINGQTSAFIDNDAVIGGAEEKNLPMYSSHRFGLNAAEWGYNIPVMEPGIYGCTAHFAEIHFGSFMTGKRVFSLHFATANGDARDFENIDVFDELNGAEFTVLTKTAVDLVVTGILSIRLKPVVGNAMLSGLTCERTGDLPSGVEPDFETDPRIPTGVVTDTEDTGPKSEGVPVSGTEVNINCGGEALGRFSAEDFSWIRGKTSQWEGPPGVDIGGAEKKNQPAVKSHRYGADASNWGYAIPLENPGIYDCSLHFSETDSQSFKVGARVFEINIMDQVLKDVDVYRDAGEAPFTAVVKTFTDLSVPSELTMTFKPTAGNAFISAITCEKTGDLKSDDPPEMTTASPDGDMAEESIDPSVAPNPADPVESPIPTLGDMFPGLESLEPSPEPQESENAVVSPENEAEETSDAAPVPEAPIDVPLEVRTDHFLHIYNLQADVTNGVFTEAVKDSLIDLSTGAVSVESFFAMIGLEKQTPSDVSRLLLSTVSRQDEASTNSYSLTLQASHAIADPQETIAQYSNFIKSEGPDGVNEKLKEQGVDNVVITLLSTKPLAEAQGTESDTSNTALIAGVTVGGILAALVAVALFAFFVVNKKRNNEPNTAAFDAPPPPMTESELSSNRERSETGASVEYLDDDSTFTAATSRAGDHVDQVGFVKDIFGRGTADGAHGSS